MEASYTVASQYFLELRGPLQTAPTAAEFKIVGRTCTWVVTTVPSATATTHREWSACPTGLPQGEPSLRPHPTDLPSQSPRPLSRPYLTGVHVLRQLEAAAAVTVAGVAPGAVSAGLLTAALGTLVHICPGRWQGQHQPLSMPVSGCAPFPPAQRP